MYTVSHSQWCAILCQSPISNSVHRSKAQAMYHMATIQKQPTEQHKKELRTEFGLHERYNPVLELPMDLYWCMPIKYLEH